MKKATNKTNKLSFEKIFFDALAENSNLNHTCPYEVSEVFYECKVLINYTYLRAIYLYKIWYLRNII